MIDRIHPALNADPESAPAIWLMATGPAWYSVDRGVLTIAANDAAAPTVIDLAQYTMADLDALMPPGVSATVADPAWATCLASSLIDEQHPLQAFEATALDAYTAPLWRIVKPIEGAITLLTTRMQQYVLQINIRQTRGRWLDVWGLVWAIPRLDGETDDAYRQRIIHTLTLPRVNNNAMAALITQALGVRVQVVDGSIAGLVTFNSNSTWSPNGSGFLGPQTYGSFTVIVESEGVDLNQLAALIQDYKAAGTAFVIVTTFAPEAYVPLSAFGAEV